MRKIIVPALIMVFFAGAAQAGQEQKGPKIQVEEMRRDLGGVAQGQHASHVFEIKNAGTETLVIERLESG